MKKTALLLSLALLNLLFIACAQPLGMLYEFVKNNQRMPVAPQPILSLTEADDGKKIEVKDGTFIEITLPVDPTSGYAWEVKAAPSAARIVVRYRQPTYVPADPFSRKPGAGGKIKHRFQALGIGRDTLELELIRDGEVADTFTVTIESE